MPYTKRNWDDDKATEIDPNFCTRIVNGDCACVPNAFYYYHQSKLARFWRHYTLFKFLSNLFDSYENNKHAPFYILVSDLCKAKSATILLKFVYYVVVIIASTASIYLFPKENIATAS